ncbi:Bug family tripartite tricarboxylate transporter substrate binding protein [Humitalea sp. 24SJ18S-53]|uniref:Bug family tripartite tricarboxylate transporter substrate binding protein n=1 Tax=Humitalea sp. 24SJ18S-53 TaxID=3422307 RepID=UPI003D67669E
MMISRRLLGTALASAVVSPALAQQPGWPNRPLTIVIGFPPGGSGDTIARAIGTGMARSLGQPVVVLNKPGAGSIIAAEFVIRSTDNHTVLLHPTGIHSLRPLTMQLGFDPWVDLPMISSIANVPTVFVSSASRPFRTMADIVAYARANPTKLNMAMAGNATLTYLTSELLNRDAGLQATPVPFNGAAPAMNALLSGNVDIVCLDANVVLNPIRDRQFVGLAVAATERYPFLPDVPTTAQVGYPEVLGANTYGLMAPASMPVAYRERIRQALLAALEDPDLRALFANAGLIPKGSTPDEFTAIARAEVTRFSPLVRSLGLRMQ